MNVNSLSNLWIHLNSKAYKMWKVHQVSWRSDLSGHPACFAWFAEVNQQTWSQSIGQKEIKGACVCFAKQKAQANDFTSQNTSSDASEHWSSDPVTIDSRGEFYELYANQVLALESHKIGRVWSGMLMADVYLFDRSVKSFFLFYFPCGSFSCAKASSSFTLPSHRVKGTLFVPSKIGTKSQCCRHHRSDMETHHQVPSPCTRKQLWEVSSWSFPCSIIYIYIHSIHFFCINGTKKNKKSSQGLSVFNSHAFLKFWNILKPLREFESLDKAASTWTIFGQSLENPSCVLAVFSQYSHRRPSTSQVERIRHTTSGAAKWLTVGQGPATHCRLKKWDLKILDA